MQRRSSILVAALLAITMTVPGNVVLGEALQEMEKVLVPCYQPPGVLIRWSVADWASSCYNYLR